MDAIIMQVAVVLLVVGTLALLLELIIPGFDGFICGFVGIAALVASAALTVIFHDRGWIFVGIGLTGLILLCGLMYNFVTKRQLQGRVIHNDTLASPPDELGDLSALVGREGTAMTHLRPYGEADFGGMRVEVSSSGQMIERGVKVKVLETQGTKIIVAETGGN
jgi:membrane-bound serine protease (ClpP class)